MEKKEIIKENLVISKHITREVLTTEGYFCLVLVCAGADWHKYMWVEGSVEEVEAFISKANTLANKINKRVHMSSRCSTFNISLDDELWSEVYCPKKMQEEILAKFKK